VNYAKLRSNDGALVHSTKGELNDEDEETIYLNFDKLDEDVDSLWPVINIFAEKKNFGDVRGGYIRITDALS